MYYKFIVYMHSKQLFVFCDIYFIEIYLSFMHE